jgi:hypothetical protein
MKFSKLVTVAVVSFVSLVVGGCADVTSVELGAGDSGTGVTTSVDCSDLSAPVIRHDMLCDSGTRL